MTTPRRKLTMQLTPLLDLLLIVIFAQYMEMRESVGKTADAAQEMQQQLATAQAQSSRLELSLSEAASRLEAERRQNAAQTERLDQTLSRQQLLGRLMVDLFQIPPEDVAIILDPTRIPPVTASSQEFTRLREQFQQMAAARPDEMVRHLLTFEEVRKRCDIWELHLHQQPRELVVQSADEERRLPLPLQDGQDFAALDGAAFEMQLYSQLKSLPQPKGLVLVTLTYESDLRENILSPCRMSLDYVIDRLRVEYAGRSQFEFADLGMAHVDR